MPPLEPLLEILELDLAADAAQERSANLSERDALPVLQRALAGLQSQFDTAQSEKALLQSEEEQVGVEVAQVVREMEAAELERYSGKRIDRDEAKAHVEAQGLLVERKDQLEERELELLELIESIDAQAAEFRSAAEENRAEAKRFSDVIQKVESEVAAEVAGLSDSRTSLASRLPAHVMTAYDRVRAQPRAGGRGAAALSKGQCGACQIKLPVHENAKMLAEPEDALIQCPQCRRVLVR